MSRKKGDPMKIVMIGAGSYVWTLRTTRSILAEEIPAGEIMLMDIDRERLSFAEDAVKQLLKTNRAPWCVRSTTNLDRAIEGADYVFLTIAIGIDAMHKKDIKTAEKYGILATIGDTYGITGISRSLRHVPYAVDLAKRMEKLCPDAWLFNYTNPLTAITQSVGKYTSVKVAGFCHGVTNSVTRIGIMLNRFRKLNEVSCRFAGVDHCSWLLDLKKDGEDLYPALRKFCALNHGGRLKQLKSKEAKEEYKRYIRPVDICRDTGYFPLIADKHIVEFYSPLIHSKADLKKCGYKPGETQADVRMARQAGLKKSMKEIIESSGKKDRKIGGEEFNDLMAKPIAAFELNRPFVDVVNYKNIGQMPDFPMGTVVETLQYFSGTGITPLTVGPLPAQIRHLVAQSMNYQELVIEAAVENDPGKIAAAILTSPGHIPYDKIPALAEELIKINAPHRVNVKI